MKHAPPVIHPFMVTTLFVLMCYREVQPFVSWEELLGLWLSVVLATYAVYKIVKWLVSEPYKAALLTTLAAACICFVHDVAGAAKSALGLTSATAPAAAFVGLCIAAGVLLVRTKKSLHKLKLFLNVAGSAVVVATVIQFQLLPVRFVSQRNHPRQADEHGPFAQTNNRPDIYYLVFDSYTSAESLKTHWGFDNSEFIRFLEGAGFTVVSNAHSNFDMTQRAMAASLNMKLPNRPPKGLSSFGRMNRMFEAVDRSDAPQKLTEIGYEVVNLSLFDVAETPAFYTYPLAKYSTLADVILDKSMAGYFRRWKGLRDVREHNEAIIARLHSLPRERSPNPRFVYAHVMLPHGPFFYDRNGPKPKPDFNYTPGNYLEQLIYANGVITNLVTGILRHSPRPPVVIVQGDHGYRFLGGSRGHEENTTILNAYYLPGGQREWVYDGITPVNTFRMLFNHYFGAHYAYWPDVQQTYADELPQHTRR